MNNPSGYWYHATPTSNVKLIKFFGLDPRIGTRISGRGKKGVIYLSRDLWSAMEYVEDLFEQYPEKRLPTEWTVLKVKIPKGGKVRLDPEETGGGRHADEALARYYRGSIPPENITIVRSFSMKKGNPVIKPPPGYRYFDNRSTKSEAEKLGRWLEKQGWQVGIGKGKYLWHVFVKGKGNPIGIREMWGSDSIRKILRRSSYGRGWIIQTVRLAGQPYEGMFFEYKTKAEAIKKLKEDGLKKMNPIGLAGILPEIGSGIVTGVGIGTGWTVVDHFYKKLNKKAGKR